MSAWFLDSELSTCYAVIFIKNLVTRTETRSSLQLVLDRTLPLMHSYLVKVSATHEESVFCFFTTKLAMHALFSSSYKIYYGFW